MATPSIIALEFDTLDHYIFHGASDGSPSYTGAMLLTYYNDYDAIRSLALNCLYGFDTLPHPDDILESDWYRTEDNALPAEIAYGQEHLENIFNQHSGYAYYFTHDGNKYKWHVTSLWDDGEEYDTELTTKVLEKSVETDFLEEYRNTRLANIQKMLDEYVNPQETLKRLDELIEIREIPQYLWHAAQAAASD